MHRAERRRGTATTVHVSIAPDPLCWTVKRARWDEETVRRHVPKLDAWTDRTARPTLKQVKKFATAIHAPFGMLFPPESPIGDIPIPDMWTIRNAGVRESSADLLETIYLCQRCQGWCRDDAFDSGATSFSFARSATPSTPMEETAARIRAAFRLDERSTSNWSAAITDLIERTEAMGVLVMVDKIVGSDTYRRLDPKEFRGPALADDITPLVFANGADAKVAQIFALAHGLAHPWLGCTALSNTAAGAAQGTKEEERWCNQIAAEVLVPPDSLRLERPRSRAEDGLDRLASHYAVSTLVVLARLQDAGYLTRDEYKIRYGTECQRVMGLTNPQENHDGGGNYYRTQLRRLGLPSTRAIISVVLEGRTTHQDAYRLLGTVKHSAFEGLAERAGLA